jgi:DNA-binding protein HU-beta
MNRSELIDIITEETGLKKATVTEVLRVTLDAIQTAVGAGDKVTISGFGSFEQVHKPARSGRNPSTGEPIKVAESWAPKFRPGSEFKATVAQGARLVKTAA